MACLNHVKFLTSILAGTITPDLELDMEWNELLKSYGPFALLPFTVFVIEKLAFKRVRDTNLCRKPSGIPLMQPHGSPSSRCADWSSSSGTHSYPRRRRQ
jgi:hypothetical protein